MELGPQPPSPWCRDVFLLSQPQLEHLQNVLLCSTHTWSMHTCRGWIMGGTPGPEEWESVSREGVSAGLCEAGGAEGPAQGPPTFHRPGPGNARLAGSTEGARGPPARPGGREGAWGPALGKALCQHGGKPAWALSSGHTASHSFPDSWSVGGSAQSWVLPITPDPS